MTFEQEQQFVSKIKKYVTDNLSLSQITDDDLQQRIEEIVEQYIGEQYCSIDQRVSIVEQVYSSIRGFGLLDSIIKDESITEVMINGPKNVFIEQNGRLYIRNSTAILEKVNKVFQTYKFSLPVAIPVCQAHANAFCQRINKEKAIQSKSGHSHKCM